MISSPKRPTLGGRRPDKGSQPSRGSKAGWLLSEDENTKVQVNTVNQASAVSAEDDMEKYWKMFAIPASKYEYPIEEKVPGGIYYAEIKQMEIRRKGDRVILDVGYWIEDAKSFHRILQSYPAGSVPFKKLRKAIADAGIDATNDIRAAIGMSEKICLAYVSKHSDIGSIIDRMPCEKLPDLDDDGNEIVTQTDQDDEDNDDFLTDED